MNNKAQLYQWLLRLRKKLIENHETKKLETGLCGLFEIVVPYLEREKLAFITIYFTFIVEVMKCYAPFNIRVLGNKQGYNRTLTPAFIGRNYWWDTDTDYGYEERLRFVNAMISYYNPRNKRSIAQIIKLYYDE